MESCVSSEDRVDGVDAGDGQLLSEQDGTDLPRAPESLIAEFEDITFDVGWGSRG